MFLSGGGCVLSALAARPLLADERAAVENNALRAAIIRPEV